MLGMPRTWHGREEDRASYLAAAAPARMMGKARPRSPRSSLARLRGRVALAKVLARTGPTALVTVPDRDQHVIVTAPRDGAASQEKGG